MKERIIYSDGEAYYWVEKFNQWVLYSSKITCVLILETFKGLKPTPKHMCCHRDDDRSNNHIDNLYWGTPKENLEDRTRNGHANGYAPNKCDHFDNEDIIELISMGLSQTEIAEMYGVSKSTINSRLTKHLKACV